MSRQFANKHLLSAKETGLKFIELRSLYHKQSGINAGWQKYVTGSFCQEFGIKLCMRTINKYILIADNWKFIEDKQLTDTTYSNALAIVSKTLNKKNLPFPALETEHKPQLTLKDYKLKYEEERKARLVSDEKVRILEQQLLETKSVTSKWQSVNKPISAVNPLIANMPYVTSNSLDQIQKKLFPFQDSYSTSNK